MKQAELSICLTEVVKIFVGNGFPLKNADSVGTEAFHWNVST